MKATLIVGAIALLISAPIWADGAQDQEFIQKALEKVREQCPSSEDFLQCRYELSPRKCKALSFGDISAWARCVRSCGSAGIISKTIGECS